MPQQQTLLDLHHKTASTSLGIRRGTAPAGKPPLLGAAGAGLSTAGFVTNSGLVMQFDAYFKEAVDESPLENHRVRKCKILVYLEDSSVQIDECRQENSGMPQGTMVKRHQIPYPEVTSQLQQYSVHSLSIGSLRGCVRAPNRRPNRPAIDVQLCASYGLQCYLLSGNLAGSGG